MKVLLTGASGLLGSTIIRSKPEGVDLLATYHGNSLVPDAPCSFFNLDMRDGGSVGLLFKKIKPDIVLHTAGVGSPDFCEFNKKSAWEINVLGTRNIFKAAKESGSLFIFTSTNQVFSGENPPYSEDSKPDPINYYGKTKVQNESDILGEKYDRTIILRLMAMYGWNNPQGQKNTATWVIESLEDSEPIKVVDDIFNNFLWVKDAANAIWKIVFGNYDVKILNIAGPETVNRLEFAQRVAQIFGLDEKLISPVKKSFFKNEAPRPKKAILDTSLMKKLLDIKTLYISSGLKEMKNTKKKISWTKI